MHDAESGADVASFSAVVHACAKANDVPRAESWVEKMHAAGVEANIVTYNSVINACARTANADRAEYWLERMESSGVVPAALTFNSLINACAKAGDLGRAEKWLIGMHKRSVAPDVVSYSTVIHACTQANQPDRAERWLEEMRGSATGSKSDQGGQGRQPNSFCLNSIVQSYARVDNPSKAAKWLTVALDDHVEANPSSFCGVVGANVRKGHLEEAEKWLARMLQEGHQAPRTGDGSHNAVANAYVARGDKVRAATVRQAFAAAKSSQTTSRPYPETNNSRPTTNADNSRSGKWR